MLPGTSSASVPIAFAGGPDNATATIDIATTDALRLFISELLSFVPRREEHVSGQRANLCTTPARSTQQNRDEVMIDAKTFCVRFHEWKSLKHRERKSRAAFEKRNRAAADITDVKETVR
jgi:hypothetical protein